MRVKRFIPLAAFALLALLLFKGLSIDPTALPAARLGQPFPDFSQPELLTEEVIGASALQPRACFGQCVGDLVLFLPRRAPLSADFGRTRCPHLWLEL